MLLHLVDAVKVLQYNGRKQLTINGCCDKVNITSGTTSVMFGAHKFLVEIIYCKNCGSKKATSNIKEANYGTAYTGKIGKTA